jgi:hypothetical protein
MAGYGLFFLILLVLIELGLVSLINLKKRTPFEASIGMC